MKAKINYKSKRTIIIAAIALVILIAAVVGTVAFIKGNRTAAAAMPNEDNGSTAATTDNGNGGESNQNEGDVVAPIIDENGGNAGAEDAQNADNNQPANGANDTTTGTTAGTTTNNGTTGTTNGRTGTTTGNANVPNQDYTQTTTVITENPWETKTIGWSPISIKAYTAAADLSIYKPDLDLQKYAYLDGDSLEELPVNTAVQKGETITYVIKITNKGNEDANGIRTIDTIPEGTELASISKGGELSNGKIVWKNDIKAGETVTVSFKVKVTSGSIDLINNIAKVNGEETPETKTPVITANKTAQVVTIVDKEEVLKDRDAKVGEKIRYTITAKNTSEVAGTTVIKDSIPNGTSFGDGSIKVDDKNTDYTAENLKDGIKVEVPAKREVSVSFDVVVNAKTTAGEVVKSVINTATVGNTPTEKVETKVANITTVKTSEGKHVDGTAVTKENPLHELDEITYTLTATNSGNAEGTVILTDAIPEGTTLNSITGDGVESNGTITWNVVVPAKNGEVDGKVEVSFTVTINSFKSGDENGKTIRKIYNLVATQDGTTITPGTTDEVEKEYVSVTVNKTWVDNETQASRRPSQIRFELYDGNSTQPIKYYNMNTTNKDESYTFDRLSKYNSDGTTITYTVQEKEINTNDLKFYESKHSESTDNNGNKTYNFTNTFRKPTDTKKVTVTKIWEDNSDAAQKRPTSVTLQLNNEDVILTSENAVSNDGNTWSTEMTVDVYNDNGEEIEYTATESVVPQWYEKDEQGTTVTNTFKAPTDIKYDITLTKVWDDNDNKAEKRPTSVKFDLYKIDVNGKEVLVEENIELTGNLEAEQWTITKNVQKYDEKANEIKYFVKEETTGSIFYINTDTDTTDLTVTNQFKVPEDKAVISVKKVWNDNNNLTKREAVTIRVTGNGKSQDIVLTSENANATDGNVWEKNNVDTNLLKYDNLGNEIKYTFDEVNIPDGYIKTVNNNEITNSLPGIKVTKTVSKVQDIDAKEMNGITVKKDDVIEYEITVENIGTIPLNNLKVTDNLNVYLDKDHPETTTNVLAENETLNANETKTYTVYYKVTAEDAKLGSQLLINTATANAKYTDSNNKEQTVEDKDDADVTIQDMPGIEIIKTQKVNGNDATDATKVQPGDEIEYTITVTNTGNTVLKEVTVTDSMSEKEGFKITNGSLNIGTLGIAPNNIATITAKYTVQESDMKEEESIIENKATVKTTSTEPKESKVDVTTIVWKADITLSKSGKLADGTDANKKEVEYGEKITYVLSAKNDGNATGTATIKDSDLVTLINENKVKDVTKIVIKDYDDDGNARTVEKDYDEVISGVEVNVPAGKTATVEFTVTATAKPGDSISNGVEGGNTEVVTPVVKTIKTKSNTGNVVGANYVLVIDTSWSMESNRIDNSTTRISAAKEAIKDLAKFLFENDQETTSKLSIVQFNSTSKVVDVNNQIVFGASDYKNGNIDELIGNISTKTGTNIQAGLEKAGDLLYNTSTGIHATGLTTNNKDVIILLSDGEPSKGERSAEGLGKIAKEQLNKKGDNITNDIYCIAFGNEISTATLQQISSGKVYSSTNKENLFESFKNIIYEAEEPVEKTLAKTTQVIYTGEKEIASDKAVTITYDGQEASLEYVITQEGTTEDGVLTYKKEDDGKYSLTFNLTDELLDKNNIVITYYVK